MKSLASIRALSAVFAMLLGWTQSADAAPRSQEIPWALVGVHVSEPGQPLEDFVLDVAQALSQHTRSTGNEACGMLGRSHDQFAITLGTSHSQIGCLIRRQDILPGFVSMEESVHSHPASGTKSLRKNDLFWISTLPQYAPSQFFLRAGPSRQDRTVGPGWLVENKKLFRFDGQLLKVVASVRDPISS